LASTSLFANAQSGYKCPDLQCEEPIGGLICYLHPGTIPVTDTIRLFKCPADQWCYLRNGDFAWAQASLSGVTGGNNRQISQVYSKYQRKECEDITTFAQGLNNGRACETSNQCLTSNCESGFCMGKKKDESCQATHECHVGLSCVPSLSFPFGTTCQPLLGSGSPCLSSTVCKIDHFCWPATPAHAAR